MVLRLAIISTSRIAEEFLNHIAEMPEVKPVILCCRPQSEDKAQAWAAKYGIDKVYTDEAAMLYDGGFDAAYVATANHLHYATARRVIDAGYSVMLEKPFTATKAEAEELFTLADKKDVLLMEAITTPYLPQFAFMAESMAKIGKVRGVSANFSSRSARYDDFLNGIWNTTFDPACLGGVLNDMNVYNLHLLLPLLGMPAGCEYRPTLAQNGVDTAGLALLQYDGFTATAFAAKDGCSENGCIIQGTEGYIKVIGGTNALPHVLCVQGHGRDAVTTEMTGGRFRMAYEFAELMRILMNGDRDAAAVARDRTLAVMQVLDMLHQE